MTVRQYLNYNFNTFFFIFCIIAILIAFSCNEKPVVSDEDYMEKYIQKAHEKFHQDSIDNGLIK